jgi:Ca2+-binding EF-hand superfamily protein
MRIEYYMKDGKKRRKIMKLKARPRQLLPEFEEEIKSAFDLFDKDHSDNIDKHELRDAMRALGIRYNKN